jgi:hypothetical protein
MFRSMARDKRKKADSYGFGLSHSSIASDDYFALRWHGESAWCTTHCIWCGASKRPRPRSEQNRKSDVRNRRGLNTCLQVAIKSHRARRRHIRTVLTQPHRPRTRWRNFHTTTNGGISRESKERSRGIPSCNLATVSSAKYRVDFMSLDRARDGCSLGPAVYLTTGSARWNWGEKTRSLFSNGGADCFPIRMRARNRV